MLFSLVSPQILSRQEKKKKYAFQNCLWIRGVSYALKAVCSHATFEPLRKGDFETYIDTDINMFLSNRARVTDY